MARRTAPLLLFTTLLVFAFMVRDGHAQGSEAAQGVQLYMGYCAGCHGADAKGGDKAPPLISAAGPLNRSDSELFRIVSDGTPGGMPPFAQIGDANMRAVLQFLRKLENNTAAKPASTEAAVTGDADSGRALYFGKAQCSQCHVMQGKGGFIASSLTYYGRNRPADEILKAITTPDTPPAPSSQVVTVTTSTGQKLTGVLRNEDNFNLELQSEDGRYHFLARSRVTDVHYSGHSLMPRDYATRLSRKELDDVVTFLIVSSKSPRPEKAGSQ
jgi:putative heme-binding domain-containing protein